MDEQSEKPPFDEQWREYIEYERYLAETNPRWWFEMTRVLHRQAFKFWFLELLNHWSDNMARSKNPTPAATARPAAASWTEFVTIPVAESDLANIDKVYGESSEVYIDFERLMVGGYRVGFSYDASRDAIICSVTCKAEGNPNKGKTFTAFAGDWYTALRVACYKHYHISDEVWGGTGAAPQRPLIG